VCTEKSGSSRRSTRHIGGRLSLRLDALVYWLDLGGSPFFAPNGSGRVGCRRENRGQSHVLSHHMDDETYIIKPKDPSAIVRLQDPTVVEQLLENPPAVLAELLAGWFSVGNGFMAAAGCRIAQAAFKGRVFEQFAREFNHLRQKGKIPDDFMKKKNGEKSWVELLTILDEEIPDEDRLEALNAMFYSVNKIGVTDGERIANYQLFQIAKRLTASQLLLLKVAHERATELEFKELSNMGARGWLEMASRRLGHEITGLVEQDERVLMQNGLLTGRSWADESGINDGKGRLTSLAFKFCENLKTYRTVLADTGEESGS
jgi:hypothetical protein